MNNNRLILAVIGVVVVVGVVAAFGIFQPTNTGPSDLGNPTVTAPESNLGPGNQDAHTGSDATANQDATTLGNIALLKSLYEEKIYLYINQTVLDYAAQNFSASSGFAIDDTSLYKPTATAYQFMVRDSNDTRLFYVRTISQPDGQVEVRFYKI